MQLLKSQLNSFYDVLNAHGFNLGQFELETKIISNQFIIEGSCLSYTPDRYFFNCAEDGGIYYCYYSPSGNKMVENIRSPNWSDIEYAFIRWVIALQTETSQIDKWDLFRKSIETVNINFTDSEEKFTYSDFIEIGSRVALLKERVSNIPFTEQQIIVINQKLDYLTEVAKDSKKIDWGNIFIGSVVGLIMNLTITPENANLLWDAIKHTFNDYILLN